MLGAFAPAKKVEHSGNDGAMLVCDKSATQ